MRLGALAASIALPLLLTLSACDRSDPPVKKLERAAEELVTDKAGETLPDTGSAGPWAPRDECAQLPGAPQFIASLRSAVEARDTDALLAMVADDVKLDFGGGTGKAQLRELLEAKDGAHWDMLTQLLDLGCAAQGESSLTLPWYFAQAIPVDPYAGAVVIGDDVPLRSAPSENAQVTERLSWEAVEIDAAGNIDDEFRKVRWKRTGTAGEVVEGYISQSRLRSMIDYRLIAARRNNRWSIVSLLAGD